jgi:hypothetical protein
VRQIVSRFESAGASVSHPRPGRTFPMTVEEAVAARYGRDSDKALRAMESVRAFVALAESKEFETGHQCSIRAEF